MNEQTEAKARNELEAYLDALREPSADKTAVRGRLMRSTGPAQQAVMLAEQTMAIYGSPESLLEPLARAYLSVVLVLGAAYEAPIPSPQSRTD